MMKNYIGVIKFKSDKPYEEIKGFKYNTGTEDMDKARKILDNLCSNLSKSNNTQVKWNFENLDQAHYNNNY